jgi:uncharacterized membrane protein YfcA
MLGLTVVGIALWNLRGGGLGRDPSAAADGWAGVASGLLSGSFNIAGPPLIAHLYRLPHSPDALRGTVQVLFLLTSAVRLTGATLRGQIPQDAVVQGLLLVPFVLAGTAAGVVAGRRLTGQAFRRSSWVGFACLGVYLTIVG